MSWPLLDTQSMFVHLNLVWDVWKARTSLMTSQREFWDSTEVWPTLHFALWPQQRLWTSETIWNGISASPASRKFRTSDFTLFCLHVLVCKWERIVYSLLRGISWNFSELLKYLSDLTIHLKWLSSVWLMSGVHKVLLLLSLTEDHTVKGKEEIKKKGKKIWKLKTSTGNDVGENHLLQRRGKNGRLASRVKKEGHSELNETSGHSQIKPWSIGQGSPEGGGWVVVGNVYTGSKCLKKGSESPVGGA